MHLPRTLFYAKAVAGAKNLNLELREPNGCHGWGLRMGGGMGSTGKGCGEGPGEQLQQKFWCFPRGEMTDTIYFPKHSSPNLMSSPG